MIAVGDVAPDFELYSDENKLVKLSDFRGQQVVIFFYPKADTPGCTTQACGFRDNFPIIETKNGVVLGISPDMPEALAKWRVKQNLPYTLLSDPDHVVAEAYGFWGEKKFFGKTITGIIRSHVVVEPDGTLGDVQRKISPKDSVARAMSFLEG